jgi:hypothetical protein
MVVVNDRNEAPRLEICVSNESLNGDEAVRLAEERANLDWPERKLEADPKTRYLYSIDVFRDLPRSQVEPLAERTRMITCRRRLPWYSTSFRRVGWSCYAGARSTSWTRQAREPRRRMNRRAS